MSSRQLTTPVIDVCVATYKRPRQLRTLLETLAAQETAGRFKYAIHIADNDKLRSAEPVVRDFPSNGLEITYDVEPVQNISLARNKSMERASGDYIATTDDDCYPDPRWLLNLYDAVTTYHADSVQGLVIPQPPPETPWYLRMNYRARNLPTGSTRGFVKRTANTLFRRALIEGRREPFDPRFGRNGGEDTAFFVWLEKRGCKLIWCQEAIVFAPVAVERARLKWILQRSFRSGTHAVQTRGRVLRVHRLARIFKRIVFLNFMTAACLVRGIINRRYLGEAVDHFMSMLNSCAYLAGLVASIFGFSRIGEYPE